MPLHGKVRINCKKGATTENQGAGIKYMGYEVYVGRFYVCYDTNKHDCALGRSPSA